MASGAKSRLLPKIRQKVMRLCRKQIHPTPPNASKTASLHPSPGRLGTLGHVQAHVGGAVQSNTQMGLLQTDRLQHQTWQNFHPLGIWLCSLAVYRNQGRHVYATFGNTHQHQSGVHTGGVRFCPGRHAADTQNTAQICCRHLRTRGDWTHGHRGGKWLTVIWPKSQTPGYQRSGGRAPQHKAGNRCRP